MAKEYRKENILKVYYSIIILDDCGNIYDEIFRDQFRRPFTDLKETALAVVDMKKHDKELGSEFGVWDYRIGKHEEDDDTDWQTVYKVYKYRNRWKIKVDENF